MPILIVAEKPNVARAISPVVGATKNNKGYTEGNGYIVSWCYGHLVEMAYPEVYDIKYKTWRLEDLPFLPKQLTGTTSKVTPPTGISSRAKTQTVGETACFASSE